MEEYGPGPMEGRKACLEVCVALLHEHGPGGRTELTAIQNAANPRVH
jgi:hypothetical protein